VNNQDFVQGFLKKPIDIEMAMRMILK
jgi:hypothetical protein